jgi:hypothetical protein
VPQGPPARSKWPLDLYRSINQWEHGGGPISPFDPRARPLRDLLAGVHARYGRPILLAETSIEGERRADWLRQGSRMRSCR